MSRNPFSILVATLLSAGCAMSQGLDFSPPWSANSGGQGVPGEVRNLQGRTDLFVVVSPISGGNTVERTPVEANGSFRLGAVAPGTYVVRLVRLPDETIVEQTVQVGIPGQSILIQLPERPSASVASTVSADQLQHPLSPKGAKMIRRAQDYAAAGDHSKAIEELKRASAESSAAPYAHSILGTEYLKTGQVSLAQDELERALQALPHDAALHSNLGYALFLRGDIDRGEQEVRKALDLDRNNSPAQRLLGYILKARRGS